MKIRVGDVVVTDFGNGIVVAMSEEWCIVLRDGNSGGNREVACLWADVTVKVEAADVASSIKEKTVA